MAGYIGSTPVPQATQHRETFTATNGQTSFATAGYTPQFLDVYFNGVKLAPADFTATNGSDVILASGAATNDILEVVAYTPFEVANQTFTGTTTADNLSVTGNATFGDNNKAIFGAGSDLQIYHTGSDSWVKDNGTGNLYLDTNGSGINISYNNSNENMASFTANGAVNLYYDGSAKLATTSTGVDITGTVTADAYALDSIALPSAGTATIFNRNTDNNLYIQTDSGNTVYLLDGSQNTMYAASPTSHIFQISNAEKMRITSSGSVGIGTSSPATKLQSKGGSITTLTDNAGLIANASASFVVDHGNDYGLYTGYIAAAGDAIGIAATRTLGSALPLSLQPFGGNVGIGTSSPLRQLSLQNSSHAEISLVSGTSSVCSILMGDGTTGTDYYRGYIQYENSNDAMAFATGTTERMRIDSSGNLLVGKTSTGISTVGAELKATGELLATVNNDACAFLNRKSSDGTIIALRKDGSTVGSIGIQSTGFYIDGESGHAGIRFAGNEVSPRDNGSDADGVVSLGESDKRFKDLYLSGGVKWTEGQVEINSTRLLMRSTGNASGLRFDGSGYTPFKNGSVADGTVDLGYSGGRYNNLYLSGGVYLGGVVGANKLDDYEEGTWTPAVSNMTVTGTLTTAGRYTKVGRMVSLMGWVKATTSIAHSVSALISGFPFAGAFVTGEGQSRSAGVIVAGANADLPSSNHSAACFVDSPNSRAFLGNFTTTAANEYIYINVVYYTA